MLTLSSHKNIHIVHSSCLPVFQLKFLAKELLKRGANLEAKDADIENDNAVKRSLEDLMTSGSNISDDEVREKIWELSPSRYAARLILVIPLLFLDPHTCLQCSQNVQA